jgi:hypothetical protein
MTNLTEFSDGSGSAVTLRGIAVPLDGDVARVFVTDCVKFIEGLLTEEQLRKKYQLDDVSWVSLSENEPLQQRVAAEKERRIVSGDCAREKAAHLFVKAVDVVGEIVQNPTNSPRHRLDGARELRQASTGSEANKPNEREKFIININFGRGNAIQKTVELKPIEPKKDDEYEPEWCGDV